MRFLVVLAGGGHTTETLYLVEMLGPGHEYEYVMNRGDTISESAIRIPGKVHRIDAPGRWGECPLCFAARGARSLLQSLLVVSDVRPDAVVSVGKDITVPVTLAAKLAGIKVVYVESLQKIFTKSLCGRILSHYADLFFVQWPELKPKYKRAIYAGRLA